MKSTKILLLIVSVVASSVIYGADAEKGFPGDLYDSGYQSMQEKGSLIAQAGADGADPSTPAADPDKASSEGGRTSGSILTGATTIGGQNYQQLGVRAEVPIGKLTIAMDLLFQLDDRGNIRAEDWNEPINYLDKIYYVSWAKKGDPLYVKLGGLEFTYLGYGSSIYGYSNMIEYPSYKKTGLELAFESDKIGGEFIFSDFKELYNSKPSLIFGGRLFYKFFENIKLGISYAADLNTNNGLRDVDGDGYPDSIDAYPNDSKLVTEIDRYEKKLLAAGVLQVNVDLLIHDLVTAGLLDGTRKKDLPELKDKRTMVNIVGADLGYSIINKEALKWDIYTQYAMILENKSWGFSLPGTKIMFGPLTFTADYRMSSDKFIFGFFNNTYELERATISRDGGTLSAVNKLDALNDIEGKKGFFAGLDWNAFDIITLKTGYQDLIKDDQHDRSINSEVLLASGIVPMLDSAKLYYIRNEVGLTVDNYFETFTEWKTPGTIMGMTAEMLVGEAVLIKFDYKYTFEDVNGDGRINGTDETIKIVSISTSTLF